MKVSRLIILVLLGATTAAAQIKESRRLDECKVVLREVMGVPEGVPRDLLDKAECVAVIPGVKKAALGVGGRWGKGAVVCRTDSAHGAWGAPLMISLGGGSFGLQIGGQSADLVLLVMNQRGIEHLVKDQFTLGADATVAAGPKGRSVEAATDAAMYAEILSYSRTRGVFAGLSLEGAVIKNDKDANLELYGERVDAHDLLLGGQYRVPLGARGLVDALEQLSPVHVSKR